MITQMVDLPGRAYPIWLGQGLLEQAEQWVEKSTNQKTTLALVTDSNVWEFYGKAFIHQMTSADWPIEAIVLPAGETTKQMDSLVHVCNEFARIGLDRRSLAIALGGGVIGDLCGFAAATYMRGIPYLQVPTTLLAQVDSSVGGKTAINLAAGKNLMGAFYQPTAVLADIGALRTLPEREMRCGMAEVVKYGAIRSKALFAQAAEGPPFAQLPEMIAQCCAIKADIVCKDEFDRGDRMMLNFGHTFGHAIERRFDLSRFNHGEAVAIGMVIAAAIGEAAHITPVGTLEHIRQALTANGLPTASPVATDELFPILCRDKKRESSVIQCILLRAIGDAVIHPFALEELETLMRKTELQWVTP